MVTPDLLQLYAPEKRTRSIAVALLTIAGIAILDWVVKPNIGLGFLYLFPILVVAGFVSGAQVAVIAFVCAALREAFSPFHHNLQSVPRTAMVWFGFVGVGLFMHELVKNRQQTVDHVAELQEEMELRARESHLREEAERQLQALIESSPAAVLTITEAGQIDIANDAAHRLLAAASPLAGRDV